MSLQAQGLIRPIGTLPPSGSPAARSHRPAGICRDDPVWSPAPRRRGSPSLRPTHMTHCEQTGVLPDRENARKAVDFVVSLFFIERQGGGTLIPLHDPPCVPFRWQHRGWSTVSAPGQCVRKLFVVSSSSSHAGREKPESFREKNQKISPGGACAPSIYRVTMPSFSNDGGSGQPPAHGRPGQSAAVWTINQCFPVFSNESALRKLAGRFRS